MNNILQKLRKIDKGFSIFLNSDVSKGLNYEIKEFDEIFTIIKKGDRLSVGSINQRVAIYFKINSTPVISMELVELTPCCGKLFGRRLSVFNGGITDEKVLLSIMNIFMELVEMIMKHSNYSSISFIVSAKEQTLFHRLINKIHSYKIINEFRNERMPEKNLCIEYCKNIFETKTT